ncbi:hypothetical protein QBC47DRAFT_133810 [Echria macrotheca]|uniref:Uncharacterized protein n=1 Tax=Echria macrotheca TaxID=438768 RepID=A0AAJ0BJ68_9PEZI|nr:hypothetical protein QBC47DRAFT_133810 [Echria macrotheca]
MLPSFRLLAAAATLLFASSANLVSAASDPVEPGPKMLDQCTACPDIYKTIAKCQQIPRPGGIGKAVQDCACVPNPDGWYGNMDLCRNCLTGNDFFNNLATMITQLFTSCTNAGGNVFSDGQSLCASNAMWQMCASLKDGSSGEQSWASFEKFADPSQNKNATQVLDIKVPRNDAAGGSASSSSSAGTGTSGTAVPTATGGGSSGSGATPTGSQNTTTTKAPSMAGRGSQVGGVVALVVAAAVGLAV